MANDNKVIFEPSIKPRKIAYKLVQDEAYNKEFANGLGFLPFLWYNGIQVDYDHIISLQLYTNNNLPTLSVSFSDTIGFFKSVGMPLDDTIISLFINSRSESLKSIHLDFKITNFTQTGSTYNIVGVVDIDDLYIKEYKSYSKKTSFDLYKEISKNLGIGMSSNFSGTNDSMTWINPGNNLITFMNDVIANSWVSKDTFLFAFLDFNYYWNFIDIEKELKRDIKEELGISTTGISEFIRTPKNEETMKLFLTNDNNFLETNIFFKSYQVINSSTDTSLQLGYLTKLSYYDELQKSFLVFEVDSLQGNDKSVAIPLRGKLNDKNFFKKNVNLLYDGTLDLDNVHRDFKYAPIQNNINYAEVEKIKIMLNMGVPNYNLKKFQKIYCIFSNQVTQVSRTLFNPRLTGEWLITDIRYSFIGGSFTQQVELSHRQLGKFDNE